MAEADDKPPDKGPKLGAGHAKAMARLGLTELRNAFTPSKESVADTEVGLYGTATQGEIAEDRGGPGAGPEQETLASLKKEADATKDQGKDGKSRGLER